jgi:hypothetical protein
MPSFLYRVGAFLGRVGVPIIPTNFVTFRSSAIGDFLAPKNYCQLNCRRDEYCSFTAVFSRKYLSLRAPARNLSNITAFAITSSMVTPAYNDNRCTRHKIPNPKL